MYLIRYKVPCLRHVRHFCTNDVIGWRFVYAEVVCEFGIGGEPTIVGQVYRTKGKFRVA